MGCCSLQSHPHLPCVREHSQHALIYNAAVYFNSPQEMGLKHAVFSFLDTTNFCFQPNTATPAGFFCLWICARRKMP